MSLADHLNVGLVGVGAASVAAHVVGALWFTDSLFGLPYRKEIERLRITQEECAKGMVRSLVGTFFSNVVRAWCIAHMTKDYLKLSPGTLSTVGGKFIARSTPNHKAGLHSAFVGFLGFILPARLSNVFWAGQPWNIFAITTAHEFVSTMLMGSIIGYLTKN